MPSPKTPECGMISFHPLKEEYTPEMRHWFLTANWNTLFDAWCIVEEKKSHLHIVFKIKYETINKKKEEAHKKIYNFMPNCFKNKEVACFISWPDKKKNEDFIKCLGYTFKGIIKIAEDFEILVRENISDEEWEAGMKSAKELTSEQPAVFITLPEIAILAKKYVNDNNINTYEGFIDFLADTGKFYTCRPQQVENIYDQACNMKRRRNIEKILKPITIEDYTDNHQ